MAQNEQKHPDWLQRWQELLTESNTGDANTARGTRVQRLEIEKGQISAQVKDRDLGVYAIDIRWPPLNDREWGFVIDAITAHGAITTQLSSGEVPTDVEALFHEAGYDLLPGTLDDWRVDCRPVAQKQNGAGNEATVATPPATLESDDYSTLLSPVYQMLGTAFHDDPWLILRLRGRDRQPLIDEFHAQCVEGQGTEGQVSHSPTATSAFDDAGLHAKSGTSPHTEATFFYADPSAATPSDELSGVGAALEDSLDTYWGVGKRLRSAQHHIAPPLVDQVLLRRLGPPTFAENGDATYEKLSEIYLRVTQQAMLLAYADDGSL